MLLKVPATPLPIKLPGNAPEKAVEMIQVTALLLAMWETWVKFLTPDQIGTARPLKTFRE